MRVILAIEEYYSVFGGVERTVSRLAQGLTDRGHEVILLTFEDPGEHEPFHPLPAGVRCVDLGLTGNLARRENPYREALRQRLPAFMITAIRNITAITRALRVRRQEVPALAHAFERLAPDVVISFKTHLHRYTISAGQRAGVPVIASEHNPPAILYGYYLAAVDRLVTLWWLRRASRVRVLMDDFVKGYPWVLRATCRVVSNGVAVPARAADVGTNGPPTILNVGRLDPQKGQAHLIRAFAYIAGRYPEWMLRIIGEGEMRSELETLVRRLGLEDRVVLPGESRDVWGEYAGASIFAMSSLFEGFGNVTAEAMASGLPVIGFSDCDGTNRLIADGVTGYLVHAGDRPRCLAAGIERLIDEPLERQRLGNNAREAIRAFDEDSALDRWEMLLREVVLPDESHGASTRAHDRAHRVALYMYSVVGAGGAEFQILELCRCLLTRGYEVHLISLDEEDAVTFYSLPIGLVWHRLGWRTSLTGKLQRVVRMRALLRAKGIGSFIGFVMGADKTVYAAVAGTGTTLIAAERNDPVIYRNAFGPVKRLLYWGLFFFCQRIVVQLPAYVSDYPSALRGRIECIGNLTRVDAAAKPRTRHGTGQLPRILNVGRLHWQKGQDLLLSAFARSGLASAGWQLRLVGSGDARDALCRQAEELGLGTSVEFAGNLVDVQSEYENADIFVFPSRYEGFPNALIEAMSKGLPSIGFADCTGVACLLESDINGILSYASDDEHRIEELAAAMRRLAEDPERRQRLGERARLDAEGLGVQAVDKAWDDLLQRMNHQPARKWYGGRRSEHTREVKGD